MSRIPDQVRLAGERSNALIEQMRNPNTSPEAPSPPAPPDPYVGPPAPAAPDQSERILQLQHRCSVLQGKLNVEGPRNAQRIRELEAQVSELSTQLAQARAAAPAPGTARNPEAIAMDEFDPGLAAAVNAVVDARVAPIKGELDATRKRDDEAREKQERQDRWDQLLGQLDQIVPGWRDADNEPEFQLYCVEVDTVTGEQRQEELTRAVQRMDTASIAVFYSRYLASKAKPPRQPDRRLEEQQVPGMSGRETLAPGSDKKTYTKRQVNEFFSNKARNVGRARTNAERAELAAIEADMTAAFREGRITG